MIAFKLNQEELNKLSDEYIEDTNNFNRDLASSISFSEKSNQFESMGYEVIAPANVISENNIIAFSQAFQRQLEYINFSEEEYNNNPKLH